MKYEYSKLAFVCMWTFSCLIVLIVQMSIGFFIGADQKVKNEVLFGIIGIFLTLAIVYSKEYLTRSVILLDEYVRFNSFRFKMKHNPISINIKYEDFWSIESRKLPIIGMWAIIINAKNLPHKITVSFCFCKHKELYCKLCELVKKYNPNVYVDDQLEKYIEENRYE